MKEKPILPAIALLLSLIFAACGSGPSSASTNSKIVQGERTFKQNCATCHTVKPGEVLVGPSLAGIASRAATRIDGMDSREYIQFSIVKPSEYVVDGFVDQMPTSFGKSLSEDELDGLITYLLSLE